MSYLLLLSILYLSAELTFITTSETFLLKKLISYIRIYNWAKKNIPDNWSFYISFITISSNIAYIKCKKSNSDKWTNDFIKHSWGRISSEDIIERMKYYDPDIEKNQLRMRRDSKIKDLLK